MRADGFERPPGVGVALALAAAVSEVVQRPALLVDVGVGVRIPLGEDVRGGAGVDGEPVQYELVGCGVDQGLGLPEREWWGLGGQGRVQRRAGVVGAVVGGGRAVRALGVLRCLRAASSRWRCSAASCSPCTVTGVVSQERGTSCRPR